MPAISVVIPVYNAAPYLREALDSLLRQTCGDFEAIVVNDGSTDNSLEILQEYAARDSRIRILDGPNGGYGKAMNRGMDAATGKYMAILEPDDYLPREAYATLLPMAEEHRLDIVRGAYCAFYEDGGIRRFHYAVPIAATGVLFKPLDVQDELFKSAATTWSCLYRIDFLRKKHIRYHESPGASYQDTGMSLFSSIYAERVMLTPYPVYMYRVDNPESSINSADNKCNAIMAEYDYIHQELLKTPETWQMVQSSFWRCALKSWEWMLDLLKDPAIRESYIQQMCERVFPLVKSGVLPDSLRCKWEKVLNMETHQQRCDAVLSMRNPAKEKREVRVLGVCLYSVLMSSELTERRVLGVPVQKRCRVLQWKKIRSDMNMANGMVDVFYILGIPVYRRWHTRCGEEILQVILKQG